MLVLFGILVKVTHTMKRLYTLLALLGLVVGMVTGCNPTSTETPGTTTNAPAAPPSAPGTNATK